MGFAAFLLGAFVKRLLCLLGPTVSVCDVETWRPNMEMMESGAFTILCLVTHVKCLFILSVQVIVYNLISYDVYIYLRNLSI